MEPDIYRVSAPAIVKKSLGLRNSLTPRALISYTEGQSLPGLGSSSVWVPTATLGPPRDNSEGPFHETVFCGNRHLLRNADRCHKCLWPAIDFVAGTNCVSDAIRVGNTTSLDHALTLVDADAFGYTDAIGHAAAKPKSCAGKSGVGQVG
jgi:hypothetical protein